MSAIRIVNSIDDHSNKVSHTHLLHGHTHNDTHIVILRSEECQARMILTKKMYTHNRRTTGRPTLVVLIRITVFLHECRTCHDICTIWSAGAGQQGERDTVDVFVETVQALPGRFEAFMAGRRSATTPAAAAASPSAIVGLQAAQLRSNAVQIVQVSTNLALLFDSLVLVVECYA